MDLLVKSCCEISSIFLNFQVDKSRRRNKRFEKPRADCDKVNSNFVTHHRLLRSIHSCVCKENVTYRANTEFRVT